MVDYHGLEVFRDLAKRFDVRMFDRIRKIGFSVKDPEKIQLNPEETTRLPELEKISISKQTNATVTESDVKAAAGIVSQCRLASIDQNENQIELNLNPPTPFGCSSQ